jgi:mannose-1-phosphate guanylyltransferase
LKNVILSGGSGTRLWPLSRKLMAKQFLKLINEKSLFQLTVERNSKICDDNLIITNNEQFFIALDQLEELKNDKFNINNTVFMLEETGKNTAPAIAFAALNSDKDEILFVTPSDHLIKNEEEYIKAVKKAKDLANEGYLVTFGIKPDKPNTGYGYIEYDLDDLSVIKFHEKPDIKTAKKYLESNLKKEKFYLWNSGMFMFKAGVYLEELKKHSPQVYESCLEIYNKYVKSISQNQLRITNMSDIPDISVDYAVMEKSNKIKVIPSNFGWSDVGSFDSLAQEIKSHEAIEIDSKNNFYFKQDKKKVIATIDVENLIVIDTPDALLITKKGESQKVKDIVNILKETSQFSILNSTIVVHRPWGSYEVLIDENKYKIKRIVVKPGKRLSLQKHFHRSEHWIVVSGTAEVQVGEKKYLVRPNESTYIKMGEIHRLSNPGKIPVVLIEAQVGEYTEEDDIIRLEDDFNRNMNEK